jgi:ADP-ribose pyrophosphatase
MIVELKPSNRLVLVRQFRPPAQGHVWEFPAGIIDGDEPVADAAARELREETGYRGRIIQTYPAAFSTPGLSSEQVTQVRMEVDEHAAENAHPQAEPDEGEDIEVRLIPRSELWGFIQERGAAGERFDSKLVTFALADSEDFRSPT